MKRTDRPLCVGVTGKLASGKSTALSFFEEQGYPVIDADQIARRVVEPGTPALEEIARTFGADVIVDGALDRKRLGSIVFSDPSQLARLNALLHPRIREAFLRDVASAAERGAQMIFSEVPLLFEQGYEEFFDIVITINAPVDAVVQRAVRRDGSSADRAYKVLAQQWSDPERTERADIVIENDGTLDEYRARLVAVLDALRRSADDRSAQRRREEREEKNKPTC